MRFWDASAIVPLVVQQPPSQAMHAELDRDPDMVAWWATELECQSAIARLERERVLDPDGVARALDRLVHIGATWQEIQPTGRLRQTAARLVRTHPLRTSDALQLAAAIIAADEDPRTLPLVTLDDRLADAARREGFPVVIPGVGA